jgi:hypothetical protein
LYQLFDDPDPPYSDPQRALLEASALVGLSGMLTGKDSGFMHLQGFSRTYNNSRDIASRAVRCNAAGRGSLVAVYSGAGEWTEVRGWSSLGDDVVSQVNYRF